MMTDVYIQRDTEHGATPDDELMQHWARQVVASQLDSPASLSLCVVDSDAIQQLNNDYRGKNAPTNVLSFPFELPPGLPAEALSERPLGDIVLCAPVINQEAQEQGKPGDAHWCHMVVHGILHLLGHDHINDSDAEKMEALEIELLAAFNIPNPYQHCADEHKDFT